MVTNAVIVASQKTKLDNIVNWAAAISNIQSLLEHPERNGKADNENAEVDKAAETIGK